MLHHSATVPESWCARLESNQCFARVRGECFPVLATDANNAQAKACATADDRRTADRGSTCFSLCVGTEGWNRTNVEGFKDLRTPIERPRYGTPGWTRTSVYRFRRAMPESPRPEGDPGIFGCGGRIRTCA